MFSSIKSLSIVSPQVWFWFVLGILVLLIIDLRFFGSSASHQENRKRGALIESALWILLALLFNAWFAWFYGLSLGIEFLTGYLVEKSLSVDNLFIILLIFKSFKIPNAFQHRILFYGIFGAIVMRAVFILVGASLVHQFHWVLYIFGFILVCSAAKLLLQSDSHEDVQDSSVLKLVKKIIPVTNKISTNAMFLKEDGRLKATPLFLTLVAIEVTDLIFAVDSIPAVFAVTNDVFVAFSSNVFAILGLRALFFVLSSWISEIRYLKPGLVIILGFIGMKMLLIDLIKVPNWASLLVILIVLIVVFLCSWYDGRRPIKQ